MNAYNLIVNPDYRPVQKCNMRVFRNASAWVVRKLMLIVMSIYANRMEEPKTLNKKAPNKRNNFLDFIKGIAIILVVLGHSIQYGNGAYYFRNSLFYENVLFKVIYSFHMPVFMMISGYLFYYTMQNHSNKEVLLSRITRFLIPIFSWNGLFLIFHFATHFIHHNIILHDFISVNLKTEMSNYFRSSFQTIWFLWAILWCSLIVMISNRLFKDSIIIYILVFLLTFIIPDSFNISLYKYMYPFFIIGYFYCKNKEAVYKILQKINSIYLLLVGCLIYLFLMQFYNNSSYIYTSGYTIIGRNALTQIAIDIYRLIVGLFGGISLIVIVNKLFKFETFSKEDIITKLGINSLGIYIVSCYLFIFVQKLTTNLSINYIVSLFETIVVLIVSYLIIYFLKKNRIANILLLGKR